MRFFLDSAVIDDDRVTAVGRCRSHRHRAKLVACEHGIDGGAQVARVQRRWRSLEARAVRDARLCDAEHRADALDVRLRAIDGRRQRTQRK